MELLPPKATQVQPVFPAFDPSDVLFICDDHASSDSRRALSWSIARLGVGGRVGLADHSS